MSASDKQIAPDVPEMRSVLIRSAPPALPSRSLQLTKESPFSLKTNINTPKTKGESGWKLSNIPKLPEMYPLERSHAYVKGIAGEEVASRIAECLRKESIMATFDDNKALAETPCHTQFYVKLFEDDDQVIVEVQRRSGCSYKFGQCSKAILRAAKGEQALRKPTFSIPASVLKKEAEVNAHEDALNVAWGLLESNGSDSKKLGMESLLQLSKENKLQMDADQLNVVLSFVKSLPKEDALEFEGMIRRDALTVLGNCMTNSSVDAKSVIESDGLLQRLIADLTDDDLHTSYQAARCLTAICQSSPAVKQLVARLGAPAAAAGAVREGQCRHALLEQETRLLQLEMEG